MLGHHQLHGYQLLAFKYQSSQACYPHRLLSNAEPSRGSARPLCPIVGSQPILLTEAKDDEPPVLVLLVQLLQTLVLWRKAAPKIMHGSSGGWRNVGLARNEPESQDRRGGGGSHTFRVETPAKLILEANAR